eukprot:CAMPEP_0202864600 /NCGR_PEP_ID=MMETSP1391-20130828/4772_1 /ASSEMBLY_ACC=CAM_ASM_000867 /TAXON_ID=1034604 /ORGANISM="Chlamydomonas leiostraca, Strain SAG 11-49" /LENGTH=284 /DNA_ID=CAMNT_0049544357 /DNA_START=424 /DNA_END=1278 /DNA_ORIENTATION=-
MVSLPHRDDTHLPSYIQPCQRCNISFYHDAGNSMHEFSFYKRLVPLGQFITIVREPLRRYVSDYYYQFAQGKPWQLCDRIAANLATYDMTRALSALPNIIVQNATWPHIMYQRIVERLSNFSFVMVMEQMDDSVVLLKRTLKVALEDVMYFPVRKGCTEARPCPLHVSELVEPCRQKLMQLVYPDSIIYAVAVHRLHQLLEMQDATFSSEVTQLRKLNAALTSYCLQSNSSCCSYYRMTTGFQQLAYDCGNPHNTSQQLSKQCLHVRACLAHVTEKVRHISVGT